MTRSVLTFVLSLYTLFLFAQGGLGTFEQLYHENGTVRITTTKGSLLFKAFAGEVIQTTFESNDYKGEQVSNAVLAKPTGAFSIKVQNQSFVLLSLGSCELKVYKSPVQILYRKGTDSFALKDYQLYESHHTLRFSTARPDEQFFGTGSRSLPLNRKGYRVGLDNNPWYGYSTQADNLNYSMPFYMSDAHYGVFIDNPSRGYIDFGKAVPDVVELGLKAGKLQFYSFFGTNAAQLVQKFTALVGRMPIPPRWAMGNFMSRYGYRNQEEVLQIAQQFKEQRFPFDAVIIDLFWFGDAVHGKWNMGNLDWNRTRFPNPEAMINDLKRQNIKTILITEPFILSESFNYKETQEQKLNAVDHKGDTVSIKEFYFGQTGLLDLFQIKTQDWYWNKYNGQIKKGVSGWWGDLGEPEKHPNYVYHNLKDRGFNRLFSADEVHNLYGHTWSQMLFEKYAKHYPQQRLFHLNRSGYAGTWRYGSFPWSGDVDRSWKGLNAQLPILIGTGLSGIPTMHSDAGGFAMGQRDPELYRRWIQMAVFSPIFRPHGSVSDPNPDIPQIESEPVFYDEPDKSILRNFVELRYQLMPYNYTLAYEASMQGKPFVRPMFFYNASDSNLYHATDQYLYGDAFLVAPVLEKGATKRKLYLPAGAWYNFWKPTEKQTGGRWMDVDVTAATIPVFVKAGSIIPMKPVFDNTVHYPDSVLIVHYYAAEGSQTFKMYEDDGSSASSLSKKHFELIRFQTMKKEQHTGMVVSSNGGTYKGKPLSRKLELWIHGIQQPKNIRINGKPLTNWTWKDGAVLISDIRWSGSKITLELK